MAAEMRQGGCPSTRLGAEKRQEEVRVLVWSQPPPTFPPPPDNSTPGPEFGQVIQARRPSAGQSCIQAGRVWQVATRATASDGMAKWSSEYDQSI